MAISSAQQKGSVVYVYGERGNLLFSKSGDLQGYTGTSVTIKKGSTLYTYNEKGNLSYSR